MQHDICEGKCDHVRLITYISSKFESQKQPEVIEMRDITEVSLHATTFETYLLWQYLWEINEWKYMWNNMMSNVY